eukprot:168915_1
MLISCLLVIISNQLTGSQWIAFGAPKLPETFHWRAIGYYNNTVSIMGGGQADFIEYHINQNSFTFQPAFFPSIIQTVSDASQYWTQIDNTLYMCAGAFIHSFNLSSKIFTSNWNGITIPTYGDNACFTSEKDLFYYIGGYHSVQNTIQRMDKVQILNISNLSWFNGPALNTGRDACSCVVSNNNKLYVIGGNGDSPNFYLSTIEYISTTDINNNTWQFLTGTFNTWAQTRAVLYEHIVFIIGGQRYNGQNYYYDFVHLIDTITNEVSLSDDRMVFTLAGTSAIVVETDLYTFGGFDGKKYLDAWQYYSIPTIAPSYSPSDSPSYSPSSAPTLSPSYRPTPFGPTPSPTNSNNQIFINKMGSDINQCDDQDTACLTISYAYNCFTGNNGCNLGGYDGNGQIHLGSGEWYWPFDLIFDNEQIIIKGSGVSNTFLYYNPLSFIGCVWFKCSIEIVNLTLLTNRTSSTTTKQIVMNHGGTIKFSNVLFDGTNYDSNDNDDSFWDFDGDIYTVYFEFINCLFTNNNAKFSFSNDVIGVFDSCTFDNNIIAANNSFNSNNAMFIVNSSNIILQNCIFKNNVQNHTMMFMVRNDGNLTVLQTGFIDNRDENRTSTIFHLASSNASLFIIGSEFSANSGYQNIVVSNGAKIFINSTKFQNNKVHKLIFINSTSDAFLNTNNFCVSKSDASVSMLSSIFVNNSINNIVDIHNSNAYFQDMVFTMEHSCNGYCINSMDSSLSIDGDNFNATTNFLQFGHEYANATNNITLCVRDKNNVRFAAHISTRNVYQNNTQIVYGDILPFNQESVNSLKFNYVSDDKDKQVIVSDIAQNRTNLSLNCFESDISLCEIYCNSTSSCNLAFITVNEKYTNILCKSFKSCEHSRISALKHNSKNNNFTSLQIICDEQLSCNSLQIEVNGIDEFKLDCYEFNSCAGLTLNISDSPSCQIICYHSSACDNVKIITDNDDTMLTIFKFSKNVTIHNSIGYNQQNLQCGNNDEYVYLHSELATVEKSISTLYDPLPCSDVTFFCNGTHSCFMNQFLSEILTDFSHYNYPMLYGPIYINDVMEMNCIGNCAESSTLYPTLQPSLSPTNSPTECIEYVSHNISSKSIVFKKKKRLISYTNYSHLNSQYDHDAYVAALELQTNLYQQTIECNGTENNTDICFVGCFYPGSCTNIKIQPVSVQQSVSLEVICSSKYSCVNFQMNVSSISVDEVNIVCIDKFSCVGGSIHISAISAISLNLECHSSFACEYLSIVLQNDFSNNGVISVNVSCFTDNSCDNLMINGDYSSTIFILFNAYKYSKDVLIEYHHWENIMVKCGLSDQKFVKYSTTKLLDPSEILNLARNEYESNRLPCEDIIIDCTGDNPDFVQSCEYKYDLSKEVNLLNILSNDYKPECYWMNIAELYTAQCKGTCGDQIEYIQYNVTFVLNMIFIDDKNENKYKYSNLTQSFIICDEYFGLTNDTVDSLSSVDAIFYYVLQLLSEINDIIIPPETFLRDDLQTSTIECKNENKNIIAIITNVSIESGHKNVYSLFGSDSKFINISSKLLSELFGIPILLQDISNTTKITNDGIDPNVIALIAICCLLLLICIILFIQYRRKIARKAKTIFIQNALVVLIGIGIYDDEADKPEIDGYLRDLDGGISVDIATAIELFRDTFNYKVHSNHKNRIEKLEWNRDELLEFLTRMSADLDSVSYDGLIVLISAHGIHQHILTSDYKKVGKTDIHRIFSRSGQSRDIPRMFIFDCCSGDKERDTATRQVLNTVTDTVGATIVGFDESKSASNGEQQTLTKNVSLSESEVQSDIDNKDELKFDNVEQQETNVHLYEIDRTETVQWAYDENNPDYKLITVNAANEGFQSKMRTDTGSYFVQSFIRKVKENNEISERICNIKHKLFLSDIIVDIQHDLESKGKQLPECKCNNGTDKIIFIKNKNKTNRMEQRQGDIQKEVEMMTLKQENIEHNIDTDLNVEDEELAFQKSTPL